MAWTAMFKPPSAATQEKRQADQALREGWQGLDAARAAAAQAVDQLAELMALEKSEAREAHRLSLAIEKLEEQAGSALRIGRDDLALQLADRIVGFDQRRMQHKQAEAQLAERIRLLKANIETAQARMQQARHQLAMAAAQAKLNEVRARMLDATQSISLVDSGDLIDSRLAVIAHQTDKLSAREQLLTQQNGRNLDQEMREAGILAPADAAAQAVLFRLKMRPENRVTILPPDRQDRD